MSLVFTGPGGTTERWWIVCALLRDCVEHHLATEDPAGFPILRDLAATLGARTARIPAAALRAELERIEPIRSRSVDDLAMSARTATVVQRRWPPIDEKGTRLVTDWGVSVPFTAGAATLGDVFGNLIDDLRRIAGDGDGEVVVIDY
jgi:hypothetical protein